MVYCKNPADSARALSSGGEGTFLMNRTSQKCWRLTTSLKGVLYYHPEGHSETEFQFPRMVTGLMKHSSHYVTFSPPDWCIIESTFK